ncbi:MAG: QueT transporter family protein [Peptococcia bacterium]
MNTKILARIAAVAAIYLVLTITFAPFSYGPIQVRVSEALTVLPYFFPIAVPGLFIGCLLANIFGGYGLIDIAFGSLATLLAAYLTRKMPHWLLAPLPPVLVNAVVVGLMLRFVAGFPLVPSMLWVGLGQVVACYGLGLPLLYFLQRRKVIDGGNEKQPQDQSDL